MLTPPRVRKISSPRGDIYFFVVNTVALECKPTSHFLAAFNFSLSSFSVSFSPTHPPSPLAFPSPLSAPQWPSPTQSLEQCEWETSCVTKAIKSTHAHIHASSCANTRKTCVQVRIHMHNRLQRHSNTARAHTDINKCADIILSLSYIFHT